MTLIIIDGLDASGKSTQGFNLSRSLNKNMKTVYLRIHPSDDNCFGAKAHQFLYQKGKNAHFASAIFFMLDVIRSVLIYSWQKYDYIIFIRYLMGTAYLPSPFHKMAYYFFASTVPTSEFMFFLDVRPEDAEKRIKQTRRQFEMFENLEQLRKIRRKAIVLASLGKWRIIDAGKPIAEVEMEIAEALRSLSQGLRF